MKQAWWFYKLCIALSWNLKKNFWWFCRYFFQLIELFGPFGTRCVHRKWSLFRPRSTKFPRLKIPDFWSTLVDFHNSFGNSSNRKHLQKKSISLWKKGVCSYWCHHSTLSYHPRTLWPLIMIESVNLCNMWPKHGFGNQAT